MEIKLLKNEDLKTISVKLNYVRPQVGLISNVFRQRQKGATSAPYTYTLEHITREISKYSNNRYFNDRFDLKEKNSKEIKEEDTIYFSKLSTYPRFKLRNFTKNKRVIKPEKADFVVMPLMELNFQEVQLLTIKGEEYIFNDYYYNTNEYARTLNTYFKTTKVTTSNFKEYLIKYLEKEYNTTITSRIVHYIYSKKSNAVLDDLINIYNNYKDKVIVESTLEKYVSGFTNILEEEEFNNISKMLKNGDGETINMVLRMLSNFNTEVSAVPLSLLILFNYPKLKGCKEWNSTSSKVLRNKLSILENLKYENFWNNQSRDAIYIKYINIITKNLCKTNEDRELLRKHGIPLIEDKVRKEFEAFLKEIDFLNSFEITIT